MTTPTRAIGSTIISLFRAYFSSFVSILLLVKVIAPEETLVIVSRIVIC